MEMTKKKFIDDFVTQFLSSWCADRYDKSCMQQEFYELYDPPIEDAYDIAENVWKNLQKFSS